MPQLADLTPDHRDFIERVGRYFEQYHLSRIGGRLLGLLTLTGEPLGLDAMAAALRVSRASVSTNCRTLADYGLAEHVSLPGDRRDYYRLAEDPWLQAAAMRVEATRALRRIAEQGLAAVTPDDAPARAHLAEMRDSCDFAIEMYLEMFGRWEARRRASRP